MALDPLKCVDQLLRLALLRVARAALIAFLNLNHFYRLIQPQQTQPQQNYPIFVPEKKLRGCLTHPLASLLPHQLPRHLIPAVDPPFTKARMAALVPLCRGRHPT